jgi:LysR family glycine cleavage system transcriptional activator
MSGLEPATTSYFDAGQLILASAAEGLGVAFMLDSHMNASTDKRLVQVFEETVESPYSYWFVSTPEALRRRPVRALHDWLFEEFKLKSRDEAADETLCVRRAVSLV